MSRRENLRGEPPFTPFTSLSPPAGGTVEKTERRLVPAASKVVIVMPDYQKMYLTMFQASEEAINLLIKAQRECEELYIASPESEVKLLEHKNRPASQ